MAFRVVSWNMRCAGETSPAWGYLRELKPDIALLQEVGGMPAEMSAAFSAVAVRAITRYDQPQRFSTAVLVSQGACDAEALQRDPPWVGDQLERLIAGSLVSTRARLGANSDLRVISVHSPYFEIDPAWLAGTDTSAVRLRQAPDGNVWVADILWATLPVDPTDDWIVGGDFNLSETFDAWAGGPRGNREYLDRMTASGYTECLRTAQGRLVPGFRNKMGGAVTHQIDHLFVSAGLAKRLDDCDVGSAERVFDGGLSDHLPIIADFTD